jgi:AcrR family transcriptional regulator
VIAAFRTDLPSEDVGRNPARRRILQAAFSAFTTNGYAETSTLEIASRAKVSKRELYALVGNKKEMLVACITSRAKRLQLPPDLPKVRDQDTLVRALTGFGELLLRERSDPTVIAVYRLAIAEAQLAPEVARTIDQKGQVNQSLRSERDSDPSPVVRCSRWPRRRDGGTIFRSALGKFIHEFAAWSCGSAEPEPGQEASWQRDLCFSAALFRSGTSSQPALRVHLFELLRRRQNREG